MKEFYIDDNGIALHAKLDFPAGTDPERPAPGPLCVIVPGLTGHMEEEHIVAVAAAMNAVGVATLRVELYGHGKSGGTFRAHDLDKWLHNLDAVLDYAKSLDFVTKLYLCGHSQGGLAVILEAGRRPDDIDALLPLAPALNIPDGAKRGEPGALIPEPFDPERPPEVIYFHDLPIDGHYITVAAHLDPDAAIDAYKGPVLLVHGTADKTVLPQYSRDAAARYANATLVTTRFDTHCFEFRLKDMTTAVQEFLTSLQK